MAHPDIEVAEVETEMEEDLPEEVVIDHTEVETETEGKLLTVLS